MNQNQQQQYPQYQQQPKRSGMPIWAIVLIVLVIVGPMALVILGILAAIAAPKLSDNINTARCAEVPKNFRKIMEYEITYNTTQNSYLVCNSTAELNEKLLESSDAISSQFFEYYTTVNDDVLTVVASAKKPIGMVKIDDKVWLNSKNEKGATNPQFHRYLRFYLGDEPAL